MKFFLICIGCMNIYWSTGISQDISKHTYSLADSLEIEEYSPYKIRKTAFVTTGIVGYSAVATSLYFAWYDNFDQSSFHLFNDWNEWNNMDKAGHIYSAYIQSDLVYNTALWAGYGERKALNIASLSSIAGQLTIEVMDGFSTGWGFSLSDLGANMIGTSSYYFQQKHWGEQRLRLKMSYWPINYSQAELASINDLNTSTLQARANSIFGNNGLEKFLKDYNGQTIWVSADISGFFPSSKWPEWLNLALGYSGTNLYGGFQNEWTDANSTFSAGLERGTQIILALDYDLDKIKTRRKLLQPVLTFLNIFKWPAPALSYSTVDGLGFHLVFRN